MTRVLTSARARSIQPSATLELSARASQLRAEGEPILNLSVGEPDFNTPDLVVRAAHVALDAGHFHYTPTPGVPDLRRALAETYAERLRVDVRPEMVSVSNGAKQSLYNAMATATDPGERVGVLRPYWVTYVEQAHALGCVPVAIDCPPQQRFRPDLEQLRTELERGLRLLVVNSPCNPTGASYGAADWAPILDLVAGTDTLIVSDEIYEDIVFAEEGHVSPLHVRPDLADRTCVVSGFSKAFAMTGWRAGFSIAPPVWTKAMSALQGHVTSNINAVTQQAAIAALSHRELVAPMLEQFRERRAKVLQWLEGIDGLHAHAPEGTFYLYVNVTSRVGVGQRDENVDALAKRLLEQSKLVVVPGTAFGDPDHLRLSFAAATDTLEEAFQRLGEALA